MRLLVLVDIPLGEDEDTPDTRDEVESAFYDPDMDDSIAEAVHRYTDYEAGDDVAVLAVKRVRSDRGRI